MSIKEKREWIYKAAFHIDRHVGLVPIGC